MQTRPPINTTENDERNSPFEATTTAPNHAPSKSNGFNKLLIFSISIGVLVIGYLMLARTVTVVANTATLSIEDNSLLGITLGQRLLLLPGQHRIGVSSPGYTPQEVPLTLGNDKNTLLTVELQPLPGNLIVQVQSNIVADVLIDDLKLGATASAINGISAGSHRLTVSAPRYKTHEQRVDIEGQNKTQTVAIELEPNWIARLVQSSPNGATVLVDGSPSGTTPTEVELTGGVRKIELQKEGFQAWQQTFNVDIDQPFSIPQITLQPALARLKVTSQPAGAQVTLDGIYYGETPLQIQAAAATSAQMVIIKEGFQTQYRQLPLRSGAEDTLNIPLSPLLGRINLSVSPANASVTIDGQRQTPAAMKTGRYSLQLPSHRHSARVSHPGFQTQTVSLVPRAELAQHLNIALLTLEQARWKKTPDQFNNTTGQALKLFKPNDTFTMGASRRQQGRRANEAQHQVTLNQPFYLSLKPVSNNDFRNFTRFHSSGNLKGQSLNGERQPVVNISWKQAAEFCNWLSQQEQLPAVYQFDKDKLTAVDMSSNGYRLPTEAEWAWAARYHNQTMQTYPWIHNSPTPADNSANYADVQAIPLIGKALPRYKDNARVTSRVGSFSANPKGLFDLAGNVSEWTHDFYGIKAGLSLKAAVNPSGPLSGDGHVIRGSSWKSASLSELRLAYRDSGSAKQNYVGFRVARYVFKRQQP